MRTIVIDPGHGGTDPGAVSGKVYEKDINLRVALLTAARLLGKYDVIMTRHADRAVALYDRVKAAKGADLFISIHCNAAANKDANGIEFWTSKGRTSSDIFADILYRNFKSRFNSRNFRVDLSDGDSDKESNYYVLKNTACPAVLIELEFISNDEAKDFLVSIDNQKQMAEAIYESVLEFYTNDTVS